MACKHISDKDCGKVETERTISGTRYIKRPDNRCHHWRGKDNGTGMGKELL